MIRADARLRVVIVNFNGGDLLERAVRSALTSQWPGEIDVVVVDNASADGSADSVETIDGVTVIRRPTNEGFGANNHGFAELVGGELELAYGDELSEPDVVALLNPDAMVRPNTFRLLAAELDPDQMVGAASPMIVFDRSFVELWISGQLVIDSISRGDVELSSQCHGIGGAERLPGAAAPVWLCPSGSIVRVPVVGLGEALQVSVRTGEGSVGGQPVIGPAVLSLDVASRQSHRIIQNAGVRIGDDGVGINRGFTQRVGDKLGPHAPLWCGAAVVLHPEYLRSIGGFDPEYFLYYEDVDLGLRGQAAGWQTKHVPDAMVEHRHSDRSVQGTELVEVLQHRNRLLTLIRHGSTADVVKGYAKAAVTPISLGVSAIRRPDERTERLRLAKWRAKALKDAVTGIPKARAAKALSESDD